MEKEPQKWKIVRIIDIAKGVGEVVFHSLFDQLRDEGISEHPKYKPAPEQDPHPPEEMREV